MGSVIHSVGVSFGERALSNEDLEKILAVSGQETSDEWIVTRTGIRRRRVSLNHSIGDLAVAASRDALNSLNNIPPIKHIIVATNTSRYAFPNIAGFVQNELYRSHSDLIDRTASGVDIGAGCGGINFALMYADNLISSGSFDSVLVLGAEKLSDVTDYSDRGTSILFGDGASAYVLGKGAEGYGFIGHYPNGKGEDRGLITCLDKPKVDLAGALGFLDRGVVPKKVTGPVLEMNGRKVFRYVVEQWDGLIAQLGEIYNNIDHIAPHLANLRCLETTDEHYPGFLAKCGLITEEDLFHFHNTSTASQGRRVKGFVENGISREYLLMFGYGAGLQACANLYRKP